MDPTGLFLFCVPFPRYLVGLRLADPPICCPECPADTAVLSRQMDIENFQVMKVLAGCWKQYLEGQSEGVQWDVFGQGLHSAYKGNLPNAQ